MLHEDSTNSSFVFHGKNTSFLFLNDIRVNKDRIFNFEPDMPLNASFSIEIVNILSDRPINHKIFLQFRDFRLNKCSELIL